MKVWMGGGEGEKENCLHVCDFLAELSLSGQPEACKPKGTCRRSAKGTGNAGQLQVVVLSVRPLLAFLSVGHVPFFLSFFFCASLAFFFCYFFFFLPRAVHLPCKMSGRLSECLDEWLERWAALLMAAGN